VSGFGPEQLTPLDFPIIEPGFATARVGAGTFVAAMTERQRSPRRRSSSQRRSSGQMTAESGGGFIPPHAGVDLELIDDAKARTLAELSHGALQAAQFRFDASDLMPREVGADLMSPAMLE